VNAAEEYRFRSSDDPSESDHWGRISLDLDADSPHDTFAARGSAGLWLRFNDLPAAGANYGLASERNDNPWLDVYQLAADWRPNGVFQLLRVGRQEAEHGLPGTFDGLSATLHPIPMLRIFAFGGRTVHFFEIDQGVFENWIASAGVELKGENFKIEADYRFLKDDVASGSTDPNDPSALGKSTQTNHSYGLSGWYRYGDWLNARVTVRGLDSSVSLLGAALRVQWLEQQLGLDAKIDVQPVELGELNEFDNPYFLTLGTSSPHLKVHADAYKGFSGGAGEYAIHLGGDVRQLINADESPFNRNLLRGYLMVTAAKIGGTGLFASLTGEIDQVPDGKGLATIGGALGWDQKPVRVELGSAYQRWQYVYFQSPQEIADEREFYGDVKVRVLSWLAIRARYSYEIFDRRLHTVTVSLTEAY